MHTIGEILDTIFFVYIGLLLIRLVVEWVQVFARSWTPHGPVLVILEIVYTLTDPPINFVRRFIPPLRIGSVALDVGFIMVFIFVLVLRSVSAMIFLS